MPQYIVTTHSPYILTAFNNLMYAGQIVRDKPRRKHEVDQIMGGAALIDPANVKAYMFENGGVRSIIDEETGLIYARELDSVSNDLGIEFEQLADVAYAEDAA